MGFPSVARRGLVGAVVLATSLVALPAFADEATAEQLFQEGLAAMKRNDYTVACDAFLQSNKADPSPGTQINLALCYEKQHKWASAWTWYRSAVGLAQQRNQREREQLAEDSANRLRAQLHYIVITTKDPASDVVVKRDGAEVTTQVAGKPVPLPIDPGDHTLEVTGTGKKPWHKPLSIADNSQTDRIEVPKLEDAPAEHVAGSDRPAAGGATSTGGDAADGSGQRTVGIVVGAGGILAALAAGGVFIAAKGQADKRDTETAAANATTDPAQKNNDLASASSYDSAAKNDQLIAIILGAGAVVLVGVGVVLFVTAPKKAPTAAALHLTPMLSPTLAGMGLGGTF